MERQLRAADLFCGGGGSSLGLALAGFDVVLGIDTCHRAIACFKQNHPNADALRLSIHRIAACSDALRAAGVQLVTCSAPCKGWSPAGHQRPDDERNLLTVSAAKVIARARVPVALFENVPRSRDSPEWRSACATLRAAGYSISVRELDACQFGVPQRRVRMFAVATLPGFGFDFAGAADARAAHPRTRVRDVFPGRDFFYYLGRGKFDQCVFSADAQCPTLRTNCDYHPGPRHRRRARDVAGIDLTAPFLLDDLKRLQGWPVQACLPPGRRDAARIIGNSVCPPVTQWLGGLASCGVRKSQIVWGRGHAAWACGACTLQKDALALSCSACGALRRASGPSSWCSRGCTVDADTARAVSGGMRRPPPPPAPAARAGTAVTGSVDTRSLRRQELHQHRHRPNGERPRTVRDKAIISTAVL